jgi:Protein of unknown function (DUF3098)
MSNLPFGKKNYQLMIIGVATLIVGFTIMTMDKEPYGFGFLGLTLGPIIVLAGFILEIVAIMHTPKEEKSQLKK